MALAEVHPLIAAAERKSPTSKFSHRLFDGLESMKEKYFATSGADKMAVRGLGSVGHTRSEKLDNTLLLAVKSRKYAIAEKSSYLVGALSSIAVLFNVESAYAMAISYVSIAMGLAFRGAAGRKMAGIRKLYDKGEACELHESTVVNGALESFTGRLGERKVVKAIEAIQKLLEVSSWEIAFKVRNACLGAFETGKKALSIGHDLLTNTLDLAGAAIKTGAAGFSGEASQLAAAFSTKLAFVKLKFKSIIDDVKLIYASQFLKRYDDRWKKTVDDDAVRRTIETHKVPD